VARRRYALLDSASVPIDVREDFGSYLYWDAELQA
jgi:hypothetical protein